MSRVLLIGTAALALAAATAATAATADPPATARARQAPTAPGGNAREPAATRPVLTLQDALALASGDQPSVAAFQSDAVASQQAAVAAKSLPDPRFSLGVRDFPVEGKRALSLTKDDFTMYMLGVMREQVRRSKREAAAAQLKAEAVVSRESATAQQLHIRRDATVAWLNAVEAVSKQGLLLRIIGDLKTGQKIMEAGVPTGASTPALALEAQAEVALAETQLADAKGAEARARAELARWIGAAAEHPLPDTIPNLATPAMAMNDHMLNHPHLRMAIAEATAAERQVDVATANRQPDVTWSVSYGFRPRFGDMVSAEISIPFPINRRNLQDRKVAEAQARASAAAFRAEDVRRELEGQYAAALADYRGADAQLDSLAKGAIPSLEAAFKAAEARYSGGQGTLELPLNIVRRYVETNIQMVEQQGKRARAAAEINYLMGDEPR